MMTQEVGFIHRTGEDSGTSLARTSLTYVSDRRTLFKSSPVNSAMEAEICPTQEKVEDLTPFLPHKPEWESMGSEVILALSVPSPASMHFV